MKWTPEQIDELKTCCLAGVSNAELAQRFAVDVTEIHAIRSRTGYTIPKVKAMLAEETPTYEPMLSALKKPTLPPLTPAMMPVKPPIIGKALETFNNGGELCIVLARHEETALIVMPNKRMAAFCVPLQHRTGETSWWQGRYFDRLEDAYDCYCKEVDTYAE